MKSSRSRQRSKNNRSRSGAQGGNVINRVFDSSGPDGKVRGTPQQIIDKYNQLARDSQLSGDRVATENFQQHAEHYLRLLSAAQREIEARREEQERANRERQAERDRERAAREERDGGAAAEQAESAEPPAELVEAEQAADNPLAPSEELVETQVHSDLSQSDDAQSDLIETPESKPKPKRRATKPRAPRKKKVAAPDPGVEVIAKTATESSDVTDGAAEGS